MDAAQLYQALIGGGVIKVKYKPKPPDVITKYELVLTDGTAQVVQQSTLAAMCANNKVERRFVGFSTWGELYEYRAVTDE